MSQLSRDELAMTDACFEALLDLLDDKKNLLLQTSLMQPRSSNGTIPGSTVVVGSSSSLIDTNSKSASVESSAIVFVSLIKGNVSLVGTNVELSETSLMFVWFQHWEQGSSKTIVNDTFEELTTFFF